MSCKLSRNDKSTIDRNEKYDQIISFLRHKDDLKFKIGDILIKQHNYTYDEKGWQTETISSVSSAPRKYIYAYENDIGIGYIKPFLASGELGADITCMTNFSRGEVRFQLDPDYVEHMILADKDEEFDLGAVYARKKKFRQKAFAVNKKQLVDVRNLFKKVLFIESLKVGDTLWMGNDMDQLTSTQYRVKKITTLSRRNVQNWDWSEWRSLQKENHPEAKNFKYKHVSLEIIYHRQYPEEVGEVIECTYTSLDRFISLQNPFPLDEDSN